MTLKGSGLVLYVQWHCIHVNIPVGHGAFRRVGETYNLLREFPWNDKKPALHAKAHLVALVPALLLLGHCQQQHGALDGAARGDSPNPLGSRVSWITWCSLYGRNPIASHQPYFSRTMVTSCWALCLTFSVNFPQLFPPLTGMVWALQEKEGGLCSHSAATLAVRSWAAPLLASQSQLPAQQTTEESTTLGVCAATFLTYKRQAVDQEAVPLSIGVAVRCGTRQV